MSEQQQQEQQEQQQLWRAAERGDVAETRRVAALLSKEQINTGDNSVSEGVRE